MAIAWSRISSKVIATPPYADEAVRVRARACRYLLGTLVPQLVGNGKREVREQRPRHSPATGIPPGLGSLPQGWRLAQTPPGSSSPPVAPACSPPAGGAGSGRRSASPPLLLRVRALRPPAGPL